MKKLFFGLLALAGFSFASPYLVKFNQTSGSVSYTAYSQYCPYGCSGSTTLSPSSYPNVYIAPEGTFFISSGMAIGFGQGNVYLGKQNTSNSSLSGNYYGIVVINGHLQSAQMNVNSSSAL
ncbi:MAG: hypothetical protein ACPLRS_05545, partial [Hydrogenobacter sp.]